MLFHILSRLPRARSSEISLRILMVSLNFPKAVLTKMHGEGLISAERFQYFLEAVAVGAADDDCTFRSLCCHISTQIDFSLPKYRSSERRGSDAKVSEAAEDHTLNTGQIFANDCGYE